MVSIISSNGIIVNTKQQGKRMRVCSVKKYVENLRGLAERGEADPIDVWNKQARRLLVTQVTVHTDGSAEFFSGERTASQSNKRKRLLLPPLAATRREEAVFR